MEEDKNIRIVGELTFKGGQVPIQFDEKSHRVFVDIGHLSGWLSISATLESWNFRSTYVSPQLREHGIGAALVKAGLDIAREKGLKVIPTCSFVDVYMREHPEYEDLRI